MCAVRAAMFMCDFCAVCHVYRLSDTLYLFYFSIPSISVEFSGAFVRVYIGGAVRGKQKFLLIQAI